MITHTTNFEDLANAPVKQTDVKVARQILDVTGYIDDTSMIWESSSVLMSVAIDAVGKMLGIVTKKAQIKLLGIVDDVVAGDTFQIRLGLYDSTVPGYEYISEGFYLVDTVDYDYEAGSTTVTMYDHMWKASTLGYAATIPSNAITYPISVADFAEYIAGVLNLSVSDMTTLPNQDYMIAEDLYSTQSGTTIQGAIQDIAGATGTTARISDTTLTFSQYEVTTEELNSDHLKTLKIGDTYGPITAVILGRAPQNDNIAVYAATPTQTVFGSVNTTTDVVTITDHGMITGNMIYITSTGTLPAPLVAGTPYYVDVLDEDTFKLAPTYLDALAATNLINLTSAGTGTIQISPIVTKEIQINNDEILDDDRQTLLPPLYNALAGIEWTAVKSDTVGLGWHEVGDVIKFTQGSTTVKAFLSEVHLTLAGSVQEQLISEIPDIVSINYQQAGGVIKTLYDTQIQVDKQNQEITSIVSEQSSFEGTTTTNFSQIYQNLTDIILTVQNSGGGNLIQNSVGFATFDAQDINLYHYNALTFWDYDPAYQQIVDGTITTFSSAESQNAGGVSGQVTEMIGLDVYVEQKLYVASNVPMSFGMRVSNQLGTGGGKIFLYNDIDSYEFDLDQLVNYEWEEVKLENIRSTMPWIKIKIQADSAESFRYTDARLLYGTTLTGWVQSAQEILSTQVQFTKNGMKIFDNDHNTETQVTYNEFSTRRKSDGAVLFEADDSGVITNDLGIKGSTSYLGVGQTSYIKQVIIPSSSALGGIAFIKVG
jgi:hypothetical protein